MNEEMVITIVVSVVVANMINKIVVNPVINRIFGGSKKYKSAEEIQANLPACSNSESK